MQRRLVFPIYATVLATFNFSIGFPPSSFGAQEPACKVQIARAGQSIDSLGAVVSEVVLGTNESPHNPFSGKESITFRLGSLSATKSAAKRSDDLMNSPAIQMRIAKQIFSACTDMVEVRFNMTATDWDSSIFRGKDGAPIKGTCVDPVREGAWPLWGFYACL